MLLIDPKLIKQCKSNNRRAHNELYKKMFGFLMNIAFRYKHNYDDAGAAVNGIFMKAILALDSFNDYKSFVPWVKTIAIRFLIDEYRKDKRQRTDYIETYDGLPPTHVEMPKGIDKLEADDILELIKQLPNETQEVFNLFAIDGFKHQEIGEMMNITESSSKWHVYKARQILKEKLKHIHSKAKVESIIK